MNVIITGAGGHLGGAVITRFLATGHRVAAIDRHAHRGKDDRLAWFTCPDLANEAEAKPVIEAAAAWAGPVDALVMVAGAFAWAQLADSPAEMWTSLHAANVLTTLAALRASVPLLTDGGAIVAIGAAAAQPAGVGMAAYAAAKSAVTRLIEATAEELRPRGIRANVVLPRIIDTPQNRRDMPDADPADWTSPEAIADVVLFLSGHGARAINGASIAVTNPAQETAR